MSEKPRVKSIGSVPRLSPRSTTPFVGEAYFPHMKEVVFYQPVSAADDDSQRYKQMKRMLRDVVVSALNNSRLIREELVQIHRDIRTSPRGDYSHSTRSKHAVDIIKSSPVVLAMSRYDSAPVDSLDDKQHSRLGVPPLNFSSVHGMEQGSCAPQFSIACARVLLSSSVSSPLCVEKLLLDLTRDLGRNMLKLCAGQPTLHPRALVVAVCWRDLDLVQWASRIKQSVYIESYDGAFPQVIPIQASIPWEIRLRGSMSSIAPEWIRTHS
jgi:hypothetical protein